MNQLPPEEANPESIGIRHDFISLVRILEFLADDQRTVEQMHHNRNWEAGLLLVIVLPCLALILVMEGQTIPMRWLTSGMALFTSLTTGILYARLYRDFRSTKRLQIVRLRDTVIYLHEVLPTLSERVHWSTLQRLELCLRLSHLGVEVQKLPKGSNLRLLIP